MARVALVAKSQIDGLEDRASDVNESVSPLSVVSLNHRWNRSRQVKVGEHVSLCAVDVNGAFSSQCRGAKKVTGRPAALAVRSRR